MFSGFTSGCLSILHPCLSVCCPIHLLTLGNGRTIRLAADTIRFDSMQKNIRQYDTDTIHYLIAYFVRRNDDDGGYC